MNTVQFEPKVEMVIPIKEKGSGKKNKRKEEIMRKVSDSIVTQGIGEYISTKCIMDIIEQMTAFSCQKIHFLMQLITSE